MAYIFFSMLGYIIGATTVYFVLEAKRKKNEEHRRQLEERGRYLEQGLKTLQAQQQDFGIRWAQFQAAQNQFQSQAVSYNELANENQLLKRDLRNLDVAIQKQELDHFSRSESMSELQQRVQDLGMRYLHESVKWIGSSLTANNYTKSKDRLLAVIERCRGIGFEVTKSEEDKLISELQAEFQRLVRVAFEREEQARIRSQIREEQAREKEIAKELARLEREREAIAAALAKALAEAKDLHSEEVERLKERLAEAEARSQRAISQAQITKSGYVYVISNLGSFGEGVFKVGMTRRLEPLDRVRELGDASVPFPFDVHMMIRSDNAPALENTLHKALHKSRLNKINPRREYFRSDVDFIRQVVLENHGEVEYVADPEALEYRQSLSMSDEDQEFIEHVYDELEESIES